MYIHLLKFESKISVLQDPCQFEHTQPVSGDLYAMPGRKTKKRFEKEPPEVELGTMYSILDKSKKTQVSYIQNYSRRSVRPLEEIS